MKPMIEEIPFDNGGIISVKQSTCEYEFSQRSKAPSLMFVDYKRQLTDSDMLRCKV